MKVTIAVSLIWFMFTAIFVDLGIAHWSEADNTIPPFPVPEFRVGKFTVEFHSAGETAGLEEPETWGRYPCFTRR